MVKRIKAQHQRHGRQWLLGTVSALSLLATAHAKADQVTVKDGDTVWDLANQYQTSVNAIEDANPHVKKINSSVDLIYAGQQLELSKNSTVSQTSAVDSDSYTVKSGDTLSQISERLHVSLADLVSWNHLSNPDQLVIGQQLIVKGTATVSQTPASTSVAEASNTAVSVSSVTDTSAASQAVVQSAPVDSAESTVLDRADAVNNAASPASQAGESAAASNQAASSAVTPAQNLTNSAEQSSMVGSSQSSAANTVQADTNASPNDQPASTAAASSTSEAAPVEQAAASSTASATAAISSADAISESTSTEQSAQPTVASSVAESTSLVATDSSVTSDQTTTADYSGTVASTSSEQSNTNSTAATADATSTSTSEQSSANSAAATADATSTSTSEQSSANSAAATTDTAASTNGSSDLTTGSVVSLAVKLANANIPYVWGGASLSGMDCSGLVDYVFQNTEGISLPHYTVSLESCVSQHSVAEAQPGDILFWGDHGSTYHCAIYIGNNQYVAAPQPGQNVEIETISPYFMPSFAGTVIR